MATENKKVTTYLPDSIYAKVNRYCIQSGMTRKSKNGKKKAAIGSGIVAILSEFFKNESLSEVKNDN